MSPSVGGVLIPSGQPQQNTVPLVQAPGIPTIPGQAPSSPLPVQGGVPQTQAQVPATGTLPGQLATQGAQGQALPNTVGMMPITAQMPNAAVVSPAPQAASTADSSSDLEDFIAGRKTGQVSFDIKQFGYEMFRVPPQLNQAAPGSPLIIGSSQVGMPVQSVPVDAAYTMGPGDQIKVAVWGNIEGNWDITVDRDGTITLPKVGVLGITGLNFNQVKAVLHKEFSKYYTDFDMNVSLGALKSIRIYVVGNARSSGVYLVPSLTSVINGLVTAGGPSKTGSLRDIQVKRDGEVIARLDVYDLLLNGDRSRDIRLQSEDVIFIPPIGPVVGVAGSVDRPAIYELKGKAKLSEAIKMAGGATADAYMPRVQVERVYKRASRIILDNDLDKVKGQNDIQLMNGDIIKVFSAISLVSNRISLRGNVRRPGDYEWKPGMRVSSLLSSHDQLSPDTLMESALVERMVPPDNHLEYLTFNLEKAMRATEPSEDLLLQPFDAVTIFNKWDMAQKDKVRIAGAVNKPGDFEFRRNMTVCDLVKLAGGLRRFASTVSAELTRVTPSEAGPKTEQIDINLSNALTGDPECNIALQEDDYLFIRTVPDWNIYRKVTISGEVNFPGDYPLQKGERLSSLIKRAGGYTGKAYLRGAVFTRQSVKDAQQKQLNDMVNSLERELLAMSSSAQSMTLSKDDADTLSRQYKERRVFVDSLRHLDPQGRMTIALDQPSKLKGTPSDLELEDSDTLNIPACPNTVQVVGAVMSMGNFVYEPQKDYGYYINKSGGFRKTADKKRVFIVKADGTAVNPQNGSFHWNDSDRAWRSGSRGDIEPGDVVVVPDELAKYEWMEGAKGFSQIILPFAVLGRVFF